MNDISHNEMVLVLKILKNPEFMYNANSIAKEIGISSMGALKILKRLEKENVLLAQQLGKATFYKINKTNEYVLDYLKFLLKREVEQAHPYVKVWANELKKIKNTDCAVLFGSVLRKYEKANDIDVLLVTDKKRYSLLKKEIEEINMINTKKIHCIYQTKEDLRSNIKKSDKVVLSAIKGKVVVGEDLFIQVLTK